MSNKYLKYGLIGFGVWFLYSCVSAWRKLTIKFLGFSFNAINIETSSVQFLLKFQIFNPTSFELTLDGVVADIYINDQKVGFIDSYINRRLLSKQYSNFAIATDLYVTESLSSLIQMKLYNQTDNWRLLVDGNIVVNGKSVRLKKTMYANELLAADK